MVSPWFGDHLHPFVIICGQMSLQVIYFLVIHKQSVLSVSPPLSSAFSAYALALVILVNPARPTWLLHCVFSVSGLWSPLSLFSRLLLPKQSWAAAMGYSSRLCPCPVGPSLPPCSLLVVRSGGLRGWPSLPSLPVCFWRWEGVSSTFVLYCLFPHSWCLQLWFLSGSQQSSFHPPCPPLA